MYYSLWVMITHVSYIQYNNFCAKYVIEVVIITLVHCVGIYVITLFYTF